jgi:undecaprenyl-diphosphatase
MHRGKLARMSSSPLQRRRNTLAPLAIVTTAAVAFTILLVLVRLRWQPLESVDHDAAARLNNLIAGQGMVVTVVRDITLLGSTIALSMVIAAAAVLVALRRRWRLAVYLIVTGAGALILDPVLKDLVGRLRPVVAHPVAHAPGNSFPSGHALGAMVCYGAVFLVFAAAVARGRRRTWLGIGIAVIITLIGISRLLLGVHFISDVIGGWAIGIAWLGLTSFAFELTRHATGHPVSDPLTEGLEPEAQNDLKPAQPEPAPGALAWRTRTAAGIAVGWVLILGMTVGIGELIRNAGNGNQLGDTTIPHWLAAHRTPGLTRWSLIFTTIGGTVGIATAVAVICLVFVGVTRSWRPAAYIVTLIIGELALFLAAAAVVRRPRPTVSHLDHHLPTSSYPSGHVAATCCVYVGLAILVIGHARGWWRWLFLVPAIAVPLLVAVSRMYRGEHHPTDVLASVCFAALWIWAVSLLIKPNAAQHVRATPHRPGIYRGAEDTPDKDEAGRPLLAPNRWAGARRLRQGG